MVSVAAPQGVVLGVNIVWEMNVSNWYFIVPQMNLYSVLFLMQIV